MCNSTVVGCSAALIKARNASLPEFREAGVGYRIAGRFQLLDQLGFAVGGLGGQFKLERCRSVVPDRLVGRVFPVPMAQQALAQFTLADEKHFTFLVPEAIDARRVRSLEFDPRPAPGVAVAFDSRHNKPSHPDQPLWHRRETSHLCASPVL